MKLTVLIVVRLLNNNYGGDYLSFSLDSVVIF